MDDEELRRLATEILPALPELLDSDVAARMAGELRAALAEPGGAGALAISTVLSGHAATRAWMRERLRAAGLDEPVRLYVPLAGFAPDQPAGRYACPACGYQWFRPTVDDDIPLCSQGHEPLRLTAVTG